MALPNYIYIYTPSGDHMENNHFLWVKQRTKSPIINSWDPPEKVSLDLLATSTSLKRRRWFPEFQLGEIPIVCIYIYMYVCMYVCMYIYMYVYVK